MGYVGVPGELLDDKTGPSIRTGVGVTQGINVIAAASTPRDLPKIESVVDAEVQERREILLVDGVPESKLGGDSVTEPMQYRQAVSVRG